MKICYYADGRYIHAERWMKYFVSKGHEMHLISFAEVSNERARELERIGIKYHGSTGNFHVKKFWLTLKDLRFVRSVLKKERIDILHCHFLGANAWYAALSGFHPYIITVMGGGDVTGPAWRPDGNIQSRVLTPYALRNADFITSWSQMMADVVRPLCPSTPIEVIHGGIHLENFYFSDEKPEHLLQRLNIPSGAKVVFSPRLMRPLSNIHQIAIAAKEVFHSKPDSYFVVAFPTTEVDVTYSTEVKRMFSESLPEENVRYVSEISHEEIADYFRLADVTVSIPKTDGTPMTVLESMACGAPTVIGNLPDYDTAYFVHEKTTLMADVNDPASISAAIVQSLTDGELAKRISEEARKRVSETGSYEFQMGKMDDIYRRLVKK